MVTRSIAAITTFAVLAIPAAASAGGMFGTYPLNISVAPNGQPADGSSSAPAVSGDNRKTRFAAFQSDASNLAAGDADPTTDVFVRDLRAGKTFLVSRGISGPATDPSIAGDCKRVAFVANGKVLDAPVKAGKAKVLGTGSNPDYALDGRAITWQSGGGVVFVRDGKKSVVGPGENPTVTDAERLHGQRAPSWGVSFDTPAKLSSRDNNPGADTYLRVFGAKGGAKRTDLITYAQPNVHFDGQGDNVNGGITAYGTNRGIITFTHTAGEASDAYYWNQHSGNADDTAHAAALPGGTGISQMVTSARANFIAFTSAYMADMSQPFTGIRERGRGPILSIDSLFSPQSNVYFKMLVDGEAI
jgi:hypothetical protein